MNSIETRDILYYMSLPYTIVLRPDEGAYVARIQELPGCVSHGQSVDEALEILRAVQGAWLQEALDSKLPIPEPEADEELPSGKWD